MPATPDLGASHLGGGGRRLALVIATGTYSDPALAKLRAPGRDASDLAAVLDDATIGGFDVEVLLDAPAESLRRQIARFCTGVDPGDLVLVYLSCHGVLDDRGRLYYAAADTDRALLAATALPAAWLNEQLEDCRGRRQILVLDCCHSGAFAKGAKGESELALGERFEGRGRVVLTGSRGTEYSFEHDRVVGESSSSVFTGALVAGLRSGEADRDGDGVVSVSELYDYAFDTVRAKEARQTPTLWTYGAEGDLAVARSPRGAIVEPAPLPEDLTMLLESARPRVRESGVQELAELLAGEVAGRALTARAELERIAAEDVAAVARAAQQALAPGPARAEPPPSVPSSPPSPPPPPDRGDRSDSALARYRRPAIAAGAILIGVALLAGVALLLTGGGDQPAIGPIPPASDTGAIAVSGSPRGVAVDNGITWVSRYDDGVVTRIDSASQKSRSISVGEHPGKIAAGEGSVWVSIEDGRELVRIDTETLRRDSRIDLEADRCKPCEATGLLIAGKKLWVSSAGRRAITTYELASGEPQPQEPYRPGKGFQGVFTVGGDAVWAVANDGRSPSRSFVVKLSPELPEAPDRTPVGTGHSLDAIAFGERSVWIADTEANTVSYFDEEKESLEEVAEVKSGITGDDLAHVPGQVIVWDPVGAVLSAVFVSGPRLAEVSEGPPVPGFKRHQAINREASDFAIDGEFAWVTEPSGDTVHKVRY